MKHRRPVSMIVILAFLQLLVSCSIHKTIRNTPDQISRGKAQNRPIIRVLMKSGETIEFSKHDPGYIVGGTIVRSGLTQTVKTGGSTEITREGDLYVIKTGAGQTYRTKSYSLNSKGDRMTIARQENVPIQLSEVDMVWTRQNDAVMSAVVSVLAIVGVIGLILTIGRSPWAQRMAVGSVWR